LDLRVGSAHQHYMVSAQGVRGVNESRRYGKNPKSTSKLLKNGIKGTKVGIIKFNEVSSKRHSSGNEIWKSIQKVETLEN